MAVSQELRQEPQQQKVSSPNVLQKWLTHVCCQRCLSMMTQAMLHHVKLHSRKLFHAAVTAFSP